MIVEGMAGLFPLTYLDGRMIGYYINERGEVFSTRQYKKPTKMAGSVTGGLRYYTIGVGRNQSKSMQGAVLLSLARNNPNWKRETSTVTAAGPTQGVTASVGLQTKGFVIATVQDSILVFGSKPKIHLTEDSAKAEVERLAQKSPGVQIVYLQIKGGAVAEGMRWL